MNTTIVYDSLFGNTGNVAKAMGAALPNARVMAVDDAKGISWSEGDLLIVGSPTQAGRPSPKMQAFLTALAPDALQRVRVAAFDTRYSAFDHGIGLKLLMKVLNFAAPKIAGILERAGGTLVIPPEGFYVTGKEGPLKEGELDRAVVWAKSLLHNA